LSRILRHLTADWTGRFAVAVVALLAVLALIGSVLPIPPYATIDLGQSLQPPSLAHPFGTDILGRNILSGILEGTGLVLYVVVVTVGLAALVGVSLGLVAGYAGGVVDQLLMRVVDVLLVFPSILLALAIVSTLGVGLENSVVAMAVAQVGPFARLVRGSVLAAKQSLWVENARSVGATSISIALGHILPNIAGPVVVQATFATGTSLLGVAALGFLGLGAQPPTPDWGTMLYENRNYLTTSPQGVIFPGMAIFLVVFALNIVGEGLREVLDPRLRTTLVIT
jgi:ABC-type dipeptide/oligopeptide/nickel transport system permease subunit